MTDKFKIEWTASSLGYLTMAQLNLISDVIGKTGTPVREFWRSLRKEPHCEYEHADIIRYSQFVIEEIPEFLLANLPDTAKLKAGNRRKVAETTLGLVQSIITLKAQLEKLISAMTKELELLNEARRQAENQAKDTNIVPDEDNEGEEWKQA